MIGTSMLIESGVAGWTRRRISRSSMPRGARSTRAASDGTLLDVGESTNKQRSLDDYLRRAALTGRDPRGGAMALVFATELAGLGR